uniref:CASP8 and FADD-like apoptosis regulator b n=1 Tax=Astyanax mexicanus TaxID=7994 RepID=A0A3B1KI18_ASTMX
VEELSEEERKRLVYLCGALDSERCADHVREMLLTLMEQEQVNRQLLMELMVRMQRYDLLKCVLNTTRTEAERLLKNSNNLSEYILMDELSENLSSSDLKSLVFLLRGTLPTEKAEKIECFLDLVVELERLDLISSSRMEVMEQNLRAIHRVDLARRLSQ